VSGLIDWLPPEVALAPDQAPVAVQDVTFVEDQASVEGAPFGTDCGVAVRDTVGTGGGGGVSDTVTVTVALALPPGPVQVRE
jgi:hypothetical protein